MKKRILKIIIISLIMISLFSCNKTENKDKKIGILNPSVITNLVLLEHNFENIYGVDSWTYSKYKDKLPENIEIIGDFNKPNIEKIVSLNINTLYVDKSFSQETYNELEDLDINIETISTSPKSYDDIKTSILKIIHNFNNDSFDKKEVLKNFSISEKKLIESLTKHKDKKFLIIVSPGESNFYVSGKDSFLSFILENAGMINVINDKGWPTANLENIIEYNPDIILITSQFVNFEINDLVKTTNAYKNDMIIKVTNKDIDFINQITIKLWDTIKKYLK